MKAQLRNTVASLFLLVPVAATLVALPATAAAAKKYVAAPRVHSLQVTSDEGLQPGSELTFTVEGTPRARGSVRIAGIPSIIPLREVERGVYVGEYTVKRNQRIGSTSLIRATLSSGKSYTTANYSFPANLLASASQTLGAAPAVLKIDRFTAGDLDRVRPGTELKFSLQGMPGANASFTLPGVASNIAMREVRPGFYEGSYTMRREDRLTPNQPVVATLRAGNQVVTANLAKPLVDDERAPMIGQVSPRDGETVTASGPTHVSGSMRDGGGTGIDPRSVRIRISGRDVTSSADITARSFDWRGPLPAGRHNVEVTARDMAGNAVNKSWSFDVLSGTASLPGSLPLSIVSHNNNATVDSGLTTVRGRTAPGASVNVKVHAVPPVMGQRLGVAMEVFNQTVVADAAGNFSFDFSPRTMPLPGTRYDVTMTANHANQTAESKLVLYQRQG